MADLRSLVDDLWERRTELEPGDPEVGQVLLDAVGLLDRGEARVAEVDASGEVVVHEWLKRAILLLFRQSAMDTVELGPFEFADKIPLKGGYEAAGVRVVPGASARWGSFLDRGVILMPSYVNIGARVGARTMVDTWATVGSCAQIGSEVHLSGGVGIGGGLEPPQAAPVIVGDDVVVGSRCMLTQGARVGDGCVLGEGVILNPGIPVIDAETGEELSRGVVPPWCVAVQAIRHLDNVVARTSLGRDRRVLLAGHTDTVPVNENARARIDGDVLHGLGATDMKAGVAVALALAEAVPEPAVDVTWVFYAGEEIEGPANGLGHLFRDRPDLLAGDAAIVGEPTDGVVEGGCQGTLRLAVTLHGARAHTARPWMGVNAIHRLGEVL